MCRCSGLAASTEAFVTKRTDSILGPAFLSINMVCNSKILPNKMWSITKWLLSFCIVNFIIAREIHNLTIKIETPTQESNLRPRDKQIV